jgi:aspartate racemase
MPRDGVDPAPAREVFAVPQQEKVAGILGGMGPEATVDLMRRIIRNTPADDDVDHVRCLVDNNPKVPSRIRALLEGGGEDPGPVLADMARRLESWGADFLCIACNTAHVYFDRVRDAVRIPVLNMTELAADAACGAVPGVRKAGIMASPAVRITRLYTDLLEARGVEPVYPDPDVEADLLALIREVKRGSTGNAAEARLRSVVAHLRDKKADVVIAACTELGIVLERFNFETVEPLCADFQKNPHRETVARRTCFTVVSAAGGSSGLTDEAGRDKQPFQSENALEGGGRGAGIIDACEILAKAVVKTAKARP